MSPALLSLSLLLSLYHPVLPSGHTYCTTKLMFTIIDVRYSPLVQAMRSRQKEEDADEEGKDTKNDVVEEEEEDDY